MTPRLLLFSKVPSPGQVKTRLAATIGCAAATELAWALLHDSAQVAQSTAEAIGVRCELHFGRPPEPSPRFERLLAELGLRALPQGPGGLGERLAAGFGGADVPRVAMGSDSPDLPSALIVEAFGVLEPGAACLAPAGDGGYVLIGLGPGVSAAALADPKIEWSSARTLADTRAALERAGAEVRVLPAWRDVDDAADLAALRERLALDPGAAPRTAAWLAES